MYSAFSICVRRGVYNFHKRQTEGQTAFNPLRTGIFFGIIRPGKGLIVLKVPWEEINYICIYIFIGASATKCWSRLLGHTVF